MKEYWKVDVHGRNTGRRSVVRHLTNGMYHLDYSPMYFDFFIRHIYPKLDKFHDAMAEIREV